MKHNSRNTKRDHSHLTKEEREQLIAPYLPRPQRELTSHDKNDTQPTILTDEQNLHTRKRTKRFFELQIYAICSLVLYTFYSIYIRIRLARHTITDGVLTILYYHHRVPELIQKDAKGLSRLPAHLSVVLNLDNKEDISGLEDLLDKVAELSAWCACVGIPTLSIYEMTGTLKRHISTTHSAITKKLSSYLGSQQPALSVRASHIPSIESPRSRSHSLVSRSPLKSFSVLLLSAEDGRDSLVNLTKTLAEMAQGSKLSPSDISTDLIDAEISESVMKDPDLLVLFTPSVQLSGYPPWQIRLTEIFHVEDNKTFGYQVFLRALYCYANAQMRYGR